MATRIISQIQSFINSSDEVIFIRIDVHKKVIPSLFSSGSSYAAQSLLPLKGGYKYF